MARESSDESQRKGQAVNTEGEREAGVEDGERNEQKKCYVEGRGTRGSEREGAGYGKHGDTKGEARLRKSTYLDQGNQHLFSVSVFLKPCIRPWYRHNGRRVKPLISAHSQPLVSFTCANIWGIK